MKAQLFGKYKRGVSTLEILIAFAVLALSLSAVIMVVFGNQSIAVDTQISSESLGKAEALLEAARANARADFALVNPTTTIQTSGGLTYTKSLTVAHVDLFTKQATSTITWTVGGRTLSTVLSTLLTNPQAIGGGNTCSSVLAGDWAHPQKTEYELGADILNDTSSGFPITSITTFKQKLYATVNNSNGNNSGSFFILDISNPAIKPIVLGQLDNNPLVDEGLSAVAVDDGHYAYVANAYSAPSSCSNNGGTNKSCAQMQVIDISNPALPASPNPIKYNYYVAAFAPSNKLAAGTSIFYKDGIVYLGLAKANSGAEFNIIDVGGGGTPGASPTNPKPLGSYSAIDGGINSILVKGQYAYIASPDNQELKILDVSNPSLPTLVGSFDAPGGGANNGNGKSLYSVGNTLYLGRTLLNGDEFYILNNTNPASSLPSLGSKNIVNASGNNTSVNGIIIRDFLAFLITNEQFQILRIDNPSTITQYANPLTLPPGSGGGLNGSAADCEGNYIFVGSQSNNDKGYLSVITGS